MDNTSEYKILRLGTDFSYAEERIILKGKRTKKLVDIDGRKAFLKFPPASYNTSEVASEKIAYELAAALGFRCAQIELAQDENGIMGILNFLFTLPPTITHTDAGAYLKPSSDADYADFYTISNIKTFLDSMGSGLFPDFVKIMVFDALIGEQDRHEDNWGILNNEGVLQISPLYDNGDSLARDLANNATLLKFERGEKDFSTYIQRSRTYFRKEPGHGSEPARYRHFDLIDRLIADYPETVFDPLAQVAALDDETIADKVIRVPEQLLTKKHKSYIIKYITTRKQILTTKMNNINLGETRNGQ